MAYKMPCFCVNYHFQFNTYSFQVKVKEEGIPATPTVSITSLKLKLPPSETNSVLLTVTAAVLT